MINDIQKVVDSVYTSIRSVIPSELAAVKIREYEKNEEDCSIIIEIIGDFKGSLVLSAKTKTFGEIAKMLYGMELPNEMLPSFASELWNTVLGGTISGLKREGLKIDITPPEVYQQAIGNAEIKEALKIMDNFGEVFIYII